MKKGLRPCAVVKTTLLPVTLGRLDLMKKGLRLIKELRTILEHLLGRLDLMKKGLRLSYQ